MRRTRMRRVGTKGRARARRLDAVRPLIEARANGRCEAPACRLPAKDIHHVIKRSHGGHEDPKTLVLLCCSCHRRVDLPVDHPRNLTITLSKDRAFAIFQDGEWVQAVPLAIPALT